jgi:hypothetical protein
VARPGVEKRVCHQQEKVYRLMNEQHLLLVKVIHTSGKREFVQFQRIQATKPLEYLAVSLPMASKVLPMFQPERLNYTENK